MSYGGDDEILHQRQLSDIQNTFLSSNTSQPDYPRFEFSFRPKLYRPKRWADAESLEVLLRNAGPSTDRFRRFPPQQVGTAPMDFGIYNDTYGDPWALTYAGQFWAEFMIGGHQTLTLSERDASVSPETPSNLTIPAGRWVSADSFLAELSKSFQLARNLSEQFGDSEQVKLFFSARNVRGRWLSFSSGNSMGPSRAPAIQREIEGTAADFRVNHLNHYASVGKDFIDLFCRDGRVLSLDDIKSFQNHAGNL